MLENGDQYGFIVIDGSGTLFAMVQGNRQTVISKYAVSLPKKHRKGGQSSVRFQRLRDEARHNYLSKVAAMATKAFIDPNTNKCNVSGIVLAGCADFKDHLMNSKLLDPRIQNQIVSVVDVAYGFNQGLNQAVELSSATLKNVSLVRQKKIISRFFDEIAKDTKKICFGKEDTMAALESGAVEILLVWEELDLMRCTLWSPSTEETRYIICKREEEMKALEKETQNGEMFQVIESVPLVDWLAEHYTEFGCQLELVQDSSSESSQFCKGFGGFGAILRYGVDFSEREESAEDGVDVEDEDDDDDVDWWTNAKGYSTSSSGDESREGKSSSSPRAFNGKEEEKDHSNDNSDEDY